MEEEKKSGAEFSETGFGKGTGFSAEKTDFSDETGFKEEKEGFLDEGGFAENKISFGDKTGFSEDKPGFTGAGDGREEENFSAFGRARESLFSEDEGFRLPSREEFIGEITADAEKKSADKKAEADAWFENRENAARQWFEAREKISGEWLKKAATPRTEAEKAEPAEAEGAEGRENAQSAEAGADNAAGKRAQNTASPSAAAGKVAEKEHAHSMLEEHEAHAHTVLSEQEIAAMRDPEGKIFLPSPPPPSRVSQISDPAGYIRNKFRAKADSEKKIRAVIFLFAGMFFAVVSFPSLQKNSFFSFFILLTAGIILFGIGWNYLKAQRAEVAENYFLIAPFAVRKLVRKSNVSADKKAVLVLYYRRNGVECVAQTDSMSSEQANRIITGFVRGRLVAACRITNGEDKAVILEM